MEFELSQKKFQYMLEKLIVYDSFPNSVISIKNNKLFSIQKDEKKNIIRFVKFSSSFFDSLSGEGEAISIEIKKVHSMIKSIPSTEKVKVKVEGSNMIVSGGVVSFSTKFSFPEIDFMESLPFGFIGPCPVIGKEKVILDVSFVIKLNDFKEMAAYASKLKTDKYCFCVDDGNFSVRLGEMHSFTDNVVLSPEVKIEDGKDLEVIFGFGLKQMSKTFDNDITIYTKSNSPAWFYEVGKEHVFAMLIAPYTKGGA